MNPEQFAYWTQGALEGRNVVDMSEVEVRRVLKSIQDHVATVFKKVTPGLGSWDKNSFDEAIRKFAEKQKVQPEVKPDGRPLTPRDYFPWQEGPYVPRYPDDKYWLDRNIRPGEIVC